MDDNVWYKEDMPENTTTRDLNMPARVRQAMMNVDDGRKRMMDNNDNVLVCCIKILLSARQRLTVWVKNIENGREEENTEKFSELIENEWKNALPVVERYVDGLLEKNNSKIKVELKSSTLVDVDDDTDDEIGHVACITDPLSADVLYRVLCLLTGCASSEKLNLLAPAALFVDIGDVFMSDESKGKKAPTEDELSVLGMIYGPFVRLNMDDVDDNDNDVMVKALIAARYVSLLLQDDKYNVLGKVMNGLFGEEGRELLLNVAHMVAGMFTGMADNVDKCNLGNFVNVDDNSGRLLLFGSDVLFTQWMMILAKAAALLIGRQPVWMIALTDTAVMRCTDEGSWITPTNRAEKIQWTTTTELDATAPEPMITFFPTLLMLMHAKTDGVYDEEMLGMSMITRGWSNQASLRNAIKLYMTILSDNPSEKCMSVYTRIVYTFFSQTFIPRSINLLFNGGGGTNTNMDTPRRILLGALAATMPAKMVATSERMAALCVDFVMDIVNMAHSDGIDSYVGKICAQWMDKPIMVVEEVNLLGSDDLLVDGEMKHYLIGCVLFVLEYVDVVRRMRTRLELERLKMELENDGEEDEEIVGTDMLYLLLWLLWNRSGWRSPYELKEEERMQILDAYTQERDGFVRLLCSNLGLDMDELEMNDETILNNGEIKEDMLKELYPPMFNVGANDIKKGCVSLFVVVAALRTLLAMFVLYGIVNVDSQVAPLDALLMLLYEIGMNGVRGCMSILNTDKPLSQLVKDYKRPHIVASSLLNTINKNRTTKEKMKMKTMRKEEDVMISKMGCMTQQVSTLANISSTVSNILICMTKMVDMFNVCMVTYDDEKGVDVNSKIALGDMMDVLGRKEKTNILDTVNMHNFLDGMAQALDALSIFSALASTTPMIDNDSVSMLRDMQGGVISLIQMVGLHGNPHSVAAYLSDELPIHKNKSHTCSLVRSNSSVETLAFEAIDIPLLLITPLTAYNDIPLGDGCSLTVGHIEKFVIMLKDFIPEASHEISTQIEHLLTQAMLDFVYMLHGTGQSVRVLSAINNLGFVDTLHFLITASHINNHNIEYIAGVYYDSVDGNGEMMYPVQHTWFENVGLIDNDGLASDEGGNDDIKDDGDIYYLESPKASPLHAPQSDIDFNDDMSMDEPAVNNISILSSMLSTTTPEYDESTEVSKMLAQRVRMDEDEMKMSQTMDEAMPKTSRVRDSDIIGRMNWISSSDDDDIPITTIQPKITTHTHTHNEIDMISDDDENIDDDENDGDEDDDVMDKDEVYDTNELMKKCRISRFGKFVK